MGGGVKLLKKKIAYVLLFYEPLPPAFQRQWSRKGRRCVCVCQTAYSLIDHVIQNGLLHFFFCWKSGRNQEGLDRYLQQCCGYGRFYYQDTDRLLKIVLCTINWDPVLFIFCTNICHLEIFLKMAYETYAGFLRGGIILVSEMGILIHNDPFENRQLAQFLSR
jgi:hypothetical protein